MAFQTWTPKGLAAEQRVQKALRDPAKVNPENQKEPVESLGRAEMLTTPMHVIGPATTVRSPIQSLPTYARCAINADSCVSLATILT